MRLSADMQSPFYYGQILVDLGLNPNDLEVIVNGTPTTVIVEADNVEGWADSLVMDGNVARMAPDEKSLVVERINGRVEFRVAGVAL